MPEGRPCPAEKHGTGHQCQSSNRSPHRDGFLRPNLWVQAHSSAYPALCIQWQLRGSLSGRGYLFRPHVDSFSARVCGARKGSPGVRAYWLFLSATDCKSTAQDALTSSSVGEVSLATQDFNFSIAATASTLLWL